MNELEAILNEFRRYRTLAEKSIARLDEERLNQVPGESTNSVAMLTRHLGGNLRSRFTNFLTEDGEKPWRNRDDEFAQRHYLREEIDAIWSDGWRALEDAVSQLSADDLDRTVEIRGVPLTVHEALARSVSHVAYHVGQVVLIARLLTRPDEWESLSIPPGKSVAYNADPVREKKP
jgi:uncharacterized damage-inducible protein DinB